MARKRRSIQWCASTGREVRLYRGAIPFRSFSGASSNSRTICSCSATHGSAANICNHSSYTGASTPDGRLKQPQVIGLIRQSRAYPDTLGTGVHGQFKTRVGLWRPNLQGE